MKTDGVEAIQRALAAYPVMRLAITPTPLYALDRLSARHGRGRRVWIKRDDLTGFALGGNKIRKLDYLVAGALAKGADTLVVSSASSFSRNAAAAGRAFGLDVHVIVSGDARAHNAASRAFFDATGATLHYTARDLEATQREVTSELRGRGRRVVELHPGGSDTIGTLGYVQAFAEIAAFAAREGVSFDRVLHASGSAATQAGLVLGRALGGFDAHPVVGVAISRSAAAQTERVAELARATASMLGVAFDASGVVVDDRYLGEGYPVPSDASRAAVEVFAREEGLLFDPVYGGKAAAAVLGALRDEELAPDANLLLIHTGGNAGVYY